MPTVPQPAGGCPVYASCPVCTPLCAAHPEPALGPTGTSLATVRARAAGGVLRVSLSPQTWAPAA